MGLFSKLMGGLVGFGLGGPIGAIIGVLVASSFSSGGEVTARYPRSSRVVNEGENQFIVSLLVLIAAVLKADGQVRKNELPYVKSFLLNTFGEQKAKESLQALKEILKQDIDAGAVASQLSGLMEYHVRLELLRMLFNVANADNEIVEEELRMITQIANGLGISTAEFNSIKAMFGDVKKANWAYDILEIAPGATPEEVKSAYRKMAMKYHPDKVAHLGEDIKNSAEEKFKQVKDAYDYIMNEK